MFNTDNDVVSIDLYSRFSTTRFPEGYLHTCEIALCLDESKLGKPLFTLLHHCGIVFGDMNQQNVCALASRFAWGVKILFFARYKVGRECPYSTTSQQQFTHESSVMQLDGGVDEKHRIGKQRDARNPRNEQ